MEFMTPRLNKRAEDWFATAVTILSPKSKV